MVLRWNRRLGRVSVSLLACQIAVGGWPLPAGAAPAVGLVVSSPDDEFLDELERDAVRFFLDHAHPKTGLIDDSTSPGSPASIAAVGFGLTALCIAHRRGWVSYDEAYRRVLMTLKSFKRILENEHGFYYHFVDPQTGERVWSSEVSSIDTGLFLAGALTAAEYFEGTEIEQIGRYLYRRADWRWLLNRNGLLSMGWKPESGFLSGSWDWYNEGLLLYALAIGSPTYPIPTSSWEKWRRVQRSYGGYPVVYSYFGSLFTYEYPQAWIDFRSLHDGTVNYWENSVSAAKANRRFCLDQASEHQAYREGYWGLTAGDGPQGYRGYGAQPAEVVLHDGTINPSGMIAAIPFVPEDAIRSLRALRQAYGGLAYGEYGFRSGFNPDKRWWSRTYLGIDLGVSLVMIENFRTGMVWSYFMRNPAIGQWIAQCDLGRSRAQEAPTSAEGKPAGG